MKTKRRRSRRRRAAPRVVGWREWVGLPDLGVQRIKAKIDTGARSSTLHAFGLTTLRENGIEVVRFRIHPLQHDSSVTVEAVAPLVDERSVRNSGGQTEMRPVIVTELELSGQSWAIELTLTRRDAMGFRMLLGRQAIRGRFAVDPGVSFVSGSDDAGSTVLRSGAWAAEEE
jgi:hypothetical protein